MQVPCPEPFAMEIPLIKEGRDVGCVCVCVCVCEDFPTGQLGPEKATGEQSEHLSLA